MLSGTLLTGGSPRDWLAQVRTYAEVEQYLDEMCDDMEGWYKPKVVAWCRENLLEKKQMINGLVQMYPGNLVESVCALGLKICEKDDPADPMFEKLEEGEEVALEKPTTGCLTGLGAVGTVKKIGLVANTKKYLVEAADQSCESWYDEGYVARRNMSEAVLETVGRGLEQEEDATQVNLPANATAPPPPPPPPPSPPASTGDANLDYQEAKKVLASAAKARRKAVGKVEDAEKGLRKAEKKLDGANDAYEAAAVAAEAAKARSEAAAAADPVVATFGGGVPPEKLEL